MNRRTFAQAAACASVLASAGLPRVFAQAAVPDEGIDYRVLREPVPTSSPGKIEVLEFFWYACPHCYQLEPHLGRWKPSLGRMLPLNGFMSRFAEIPIKRSSTPWSTWPC